MWKHIRNLIIIAIILGAGAYFWLTRPDQARLTEAQVSGTQPNISDPRPEGIPTVSIAEPVGWAANELPKAAQGLTVQRFADGLEHPRSMLVLPNGDVLVAETRGPENKGGGFLGWISKRMMAKAGATGLSPNRIMLLRDTDGDGKADVKQPYITQGLNSPYGMALVGETLYVANTDALVSFPYKEGENTIATAPTKIMNLPATAPNRHWTKNLVASPDGKLLYVAVGSNSNIAEGGIENEAWRAAVLEIDLATRKYRIQSDGVRNPVGMAFHPTSGELWMVVNERDMLGSDLVPDYLARAEIGTTYGWPYYYWGGYEDPRVVDEAPEDLRQYMRRPDYALGAHVSPLGLVFANNAKLGGNWTNGAIIAEHGSWNRVPMSGYKVVFVKFDERGRPVNQPPVDILTGFLASDGKTTKGRPTDVKIAGDGSVLVTDDTAGIVWRIAASGAASGSTTAPTNPTAPTTATKQ